METKSISYQFKTVAQLEEAYLPYFINGALLIPTEEHYELNTMIQLTLTLPSHPTPQCFTAKVIWTTPQGYSSIQPVIGVQLLDQTIQALINNFKEKLAVHPNP